MLRKKSSKMSQGEAKSDFCQLDTTGQSNPPVSDDSHSDSVVIQVITLGDLDHGRNLLFTDTVYESMSLLKPYANPQQILFTKFKQGLQAAKERLFDLVSEGDIDQLQQLLTTYPISLTSIKYHQSQNLLHCAFYQGNIDIARYLLEKEPALMNQPNSRFQTPLNWLIKYQPSLIRHILNEYQLLIDWSYADNYGNNYLHYLQYYGCEVEGVPANLNTININGVLPLNLKPKPQQERIRQNYVMKVVKNLKKEKKSKTLSQVVQTICVRRDYKKAATLRKAANFNPIRKLEPKKSRRRETAWSSRCIKYRNQNQFEMGALLGKGAFADVRRVKFKETGTLYALKCIHKSRLNHQLARYTFNQKQMLSKLDSKHIVKVYASFQNSEYLFLVLELCRNGSLRDLLNKCIQLPQNYIRLVACELIEAIGYLHEKCIIYRDLKPQNIGFDEAGHIKVLDFGLSKQGIRSNSICGSHAYLAPQMIQEKEYSFGLDWYMLGVVLYQMVMKTPPFSCQQTSILSARSRPPTAKSVQLKCASDEMQNFVSRLLQRTPSSRLGYKRDAEELRKHPWFFGIDWQKVRNGQYSMSASYLFQYKHPTRFNLYEATHQPDHLGEMEFADIEGWDENIQVLM